MFDHIGLGVSDYESSKRFFLRALAPLHVEMVMEGPHGLGMGTQGKPSFWLYPTAQQPTPLHLAFSAETRAQVDAF